MWPGPQSNHCGLPFGVNTVQGPSGLAGSVQVYCPSPFFVSILIEIYYSSELWSSRTLDFQHLG